MDKGSCWVVSRRIESSMNSYPKGAHRRTRVTGSLSRTEVGDRREEDECKRMQGSYAAGF